MLLSQIIKHTDYDDTQFTDTEREAVEGQRSCIYHLPYPEKKK